MLKQQNNWAGYTYVWNDAQTDATLAPEQGLDQTFIIKSPTHAGTERSAVPDPTPRQQTWHYPSRAECLVCHSRAANFALGLSDLQMNRDFTYPSGEGGQTDNQIRTLAHIGALKIDYATLNPARPALPDPRDESKPLEARARSYLHANCAHCHIEAGGGNASVDLDFSTSGPNTRLFDVAAQSNLLSTPDAKLIATGHPDRSNLFHRVSIRGAGQMPPVGSNVVDAAGTKLIETWISRMPASTQPAP